ncbi:Diisopropyl-fluorophosphatase [Mytilus coruscus]|uniref:Diisopropyl-fluorophosphatase n=1 Tax=Mytilus coruscus TaxID=42192 RepID=A0A6J8B1X1_MYTCO|nr:Diisopropyl-fluorophosphatase [Mytilus coruscus]
MADDAITLQHILEPQFFKIAEGFPGAEGPVFDKCGNFYMVAPEVKNNGNFAGQVVKIDLDTCKSTVICEPNIDGFGGIPAGCQCDKNNTIWIADMRLGILTMNQSGQFNQVNMIWIADMRLGILTMDQSGQSNQVNMIWLADMRICILPMNQSGQFNQEAFGSVYCVTNQNEVIKVDTGYLFSNGIAVQHSSDGKPQMLIVAETRTRSLWVYDILGPGVVGKRTLWGKLPECPSVDGVTTGPDGMDFDEAGNLIVAHIRSGYLEVFGPSGGRPHTRIKCPFLKPSNVHFLPGGSTVYVTEHEFNGLWKFQWLRKGQPQYCEL